MRRLLCLIAVLSIPLDSKAASKSFLSVDTSPRTLIEQPDGDAVERVGRIRFNQSALNLKSDPAGDSSGLFTAKDAPSSLNIELFTDLQLTLVKKRSYENTSGKLVWIGTVAGSPLSAANFIIDSEGVTGNIRYKGKLYQIRSQQDNGSSKVVQLDSSKLTLNNELHASENHKQKTLTEKAKAQELHQTKASSQEQYTPVIFPVESEVKGFETTNQIDVLVYYSNTALAVEPDLLDAIELDFIDTNLAFENSNIDYRVNMVTALAIDDRERLRQNNISLMLNRESHFRLLDTERHKYEADLVHFFGYGLSFFACGEAYITVEFDGTAWPGGNVGVTSASCTGNLTFAHEIGHNLGAHHERYIQSESAIQQGDYAFGYVDDENNFKTLMSYGNECSGVCDTITHFSNPDILHNNLPTGIDEQQDNSAHNQKIIQLGGNTVANYGGPTLPASPLASNGLFADKIEVSWQQYPNASDYQLLRSRIFNDETCEVLQPNYYYDHLIVYEGANTSYTDTDVSSGMNYCYYVRARNSELLTGLYSPYSHPELGYVENFISRVEDVDDVLVTGESTHTLVVNTLGTDNLSAVVTQHNFGQVPELTIEKSAENRFNLTVENVNSKDGSALIELISDAGNKELFVISFTGFGNSAPVVSDIAPQTVLQSGRLSIPFSIEDDDNIDSLQVVLRNNNSTVISSGDYELVALDEVGEYQIDIALSGLKVGEVDFFILVNDGVNFVTKSFTVTVERTRFSAPVAQNITLYVEPNKTITRYFPVYDFDGDELTFEIISQPASGTVSIEGSYHFSFTTQDVVSNDSFSFSVTDPSSGEVRTVEVDVKPAEPVSLKAQTKVLSLYSSTLLLNHQGKVWFWGLKNAVLGMSYFENTILVNQPERIFNAGWADIGVNNNGLTFWLKHDGTLWLTGYWNGETHSSPSQINQDTDWQSMSCGEDCYFTKTDGSVWVFDFDDGDSDRYFFSPTIVIDAFTQIIPLYNVDKLSAPQVRRLFFQADNKLYSWGDYRLGRAADMTEFGVIELPSENLLSIQTSFWSTYLHYSDRIVAWGAGANGLFADFDDPVLPVTIDNRAYSDFSFSNQYAIGVTDGELWSWGGAAVGENYQLGRGLSPSIFPGQVGNDSDWHMAFTGEDTSFAIKNDGSFWVVGGELDHEESFYPANRIGLGEGIYHVEEFTKNPYITPEILGFIDFDNDGIQDIVDPDDDNDGVYDLADFAPNDASESIDTDGDGIGNNADTDDDGDGVADAQDEFPLDANESVDTDGDGIGNNADTDDDGDGVADIEDAFPLDKGESVDTDRDGIGNNADTDDDNDGVTDSQDAYPLDASRSQQQSNEQGESGGSIGGVLYFVMLFFVLLKVRRERSVKLAR